MENRLMLIPEIFERNQKDFYRELLGKHDIHSQHAVAWYDGGQEARFADLVKIIPDKLSPRSLLDVGCGLGDLSGFLAAKGYSNVDYTGIDALEEMVRAALRKYPGIRVHRLEFTTENLNREHDFLVCSGTMNFKMFRSPDRQKRFIAGFIKRLYEFSRLGCSFNLLSASDKRHFGKDDHVYYAERNEIYRTCREVCGDVELIYRSEIFGFTVYMRKG